MTGALAEIRVGNSRREGRTRMCAVTRKVRPESELIRFVAAPDGSIVPDLKARLPGRGIWLDGKRAIVVEAVRRNAFQRGLKRPVKLAADLPDQVAARLREAALGRLGLARRAGAVAAGFAKTEAVIAYDEPAAVLAAADAAEDGLRKMRQTLRRRFGDSAPFPVICLFGSAELGLAMGRADVIHAAVLQGPAGRSFVEAATRLQRYEGADDGRTRKQRSSRRN
ncbi:MAG: RNA-binding protein [Propylenella sp.]